MVDKYWNARGFSLALMPGNPRIPPANAGLKLVLDGKSCGLFYWGWLILDW
jgi:hypothetical protein